jgi:O-methyltransferase
MTNSSHPAPDLKDAYAELLKLSLLDLLAAETYNAVPQPDGKSLRIVRAGEKGRERRLNGRGWPAHGLTMIGGKRMDNLRACVEDVLSGGVPGDLIETGVWRGGATIFMRGLLHAHGVTDRTVWVADSFEGVPPPDPERYPADAGDTTYLHDFLSVPLEQVKRNFERYGLLDHQVRFLKGWFRDTLPTLRDHRWAVIRLDGDLYESTMDGLESLYPGLSPGGHLIVDDYGAYESCRRAVDDYRAAKGITEAIEEIDWTAVGWKKSQA